MPVFFLLLLAIIWGSSFILMKKGLQVFSPLEVAALRMFLAGLVLFPIVAKNLKKYWRIFPYFIIVGVIGNGIPAFLYPLAETKISSGNAGALNALTAIFTLVLGLLFFKTKWSNRKSLGILIGFLGVLPLTLLRADGSFEINYLFALLIVLATICYGFSTNIIKSKLQEVDSFTVVSISLFCICIPYGLSLFGIGFFQKFKSNDLAWEAFGYIAILALIGTTGALVLFNEVVRIKNAVFAASVTYLIPIVALFWGWLDGETFGFWQIVGLFSILFGVYLTVNDK